MTDNNAPASAPLRARDRARAELVAEIIRSARGQLATHGAAALSLRAVSRDLGMASSALYRYFPSRDALLTALIIESYDALADACERAHAEARADDHLERWRRIAHTIRDWARANPHEYALIYGSPVPGYAAPEDTIDPATRIPFLLLALLADVASSSDAAVPRTVGVEIPKALADQVATLRSQGAEDVDDALVLAGVGAWTLLFGMVTFELFGQFVDSFDDVDALFAYQVDAAAERLGLRATRPR